MTDLAARAVDPAFRVFGRAATYAPPAGDPVAVTVVLTKPDPMGWDPAARASDLIPTGLRLAPAEQDLAWLADLRMAEVAQPGRGASLTIGSQVYPVRRVDLDETGVVWRLALGRPAAVTP